jgi:hypothetical protein
MASFSHIPIPAPLKFTSSYIAADWKRFKSQYFNYEVAAELSDKSKRKRAAVFFACVGTEAYKIYQTFEFDDENDRSHIDKIIEAFQRHCVGEIYVTYERYVFNQRTQSPGETFDVFVADLRRLAKTCHMAVSRTQFYEIESSLVFAMMQHAESSCKGANSS